MRTKSNLTVNSGIYPFARIISEQCAGGAVGVVYGDKNAADSLLEVLRKSGVTAVSQPLRALNKLSPAIKYVIVVGDGACAAAVRDAIGDRRYSCYCTEISPYYFMPRRFCGEKEGSFCEYAYFDENYVDVTAPKILCSGIVSLTSMLLELCNAEASELRYPYRESRLFSLTKEAKSLLVGKRDKDGYLRQAVTCVKGCAEYLTENGLCPVGYYLKECYPAVTDGMEFFISYLCFYLAKIFTKKDFFDMLIPAKRLNGENGAENYLAFSKEAEKIFPSRDELRQLSVIFRGAGGEVSTEDITEVFDALFDGGVIAEGYLAAALNEGIAEGIICYGKTQ